MGQIQRDQGLWSSWSLFFGKTRGLWADLGSNPRGLEAYFRQIQLKHGVWSPVLDQIPLDHWFWRPILGLIQLEQGVWRPILDQIQLAEGVLGQIMLD